jgi:hypothetical protein
LSFQLILHSHIGATAGAGHWPLAPVFAAVRHTFRKKFAEFRGLPAFADGITSNSLGIAAAGGFAVFIFVMLFWGR